MGAGTFFVYMMANKPRGTIYVGVTSNLMGRSWQHRSGVVDGFTARYGLHRLVWFEAHTSIEAAIRREKRLKRYERRWKIELIEAENPDWIDLFPSLSP